ncbi:hypothetical protein RFI_24727, partial [Reticulomyxa filosa]
KCEVCEIRSYCSSRCQKLDWQYHQLVCHSHDPQKSFRRLSATKRVTKEFMDIICECASLTHLNLSYTFVGMEDRSVSELSKKCKHLCELCLSGCDISSNALIELSRRLKLKMFHCRLARNLSNRSVESLVDFCGQYLEDLDLSRCINCKRLKRVNIACGIKRGAWIWGLNDEIGQALSDLKDLTYLGMVDSGQMTDEIFDRLAKKPNLCIDRLRSDIQFHNNFQPGNDKKPVKLERIENGTVVHQHTFRR